MHFIVCLMYLSGIYKEVYRLQPTNTLVCLLIGLCFIGMMGKSKKVKFSRYRNTLILQVSYTYVLK